ncbi:inner nuclear membrane protein Man1-like isoform X2 [Neocloeon triangulifer]|uniref:inner nuclear membrane protein Man1-like isoform X2 n=1 Tax=Neocloeon triangulifer TaxID=2078957 RepID=UPI00286EF4A3|nr:inner nuclear membrane protein Man1-like isoform X2 [Neocloeon triangulifer]
MSNIPVEISRLSDEQLRAAFMERGQPVGPVTDTTRKAYQNKLASIMGFGTPKKTTTPRKSTPKKQSLAAVSSEEEDEEPMVPVVSRRQATPPKRKSVLPQSPQTPVITPQVSTPESSVTRKRSAAKIIKTKPVKPATPISYDTGSDSDVPVEQPKETRRSTHSYWRQTTVTPSSSTTAPGNSPFVSDFGKRLSLNTFNGHSTRTDLGPQRMPTSAHESIGPSWSHKFFTLVFPVLLVGFFAFLIFRYNGMPAAPRDIAEKIDPYFKNLEMRPDTVIPVCKDTQVQGINCIMYNDALPTMEHLRFLAPKIKKKYVDAICYPTGEQEGVEFAEAYPISDLGYELDVRGVSDSETVMNNIRVMVRHNPKWGLEITNQGKAITLTEACLPTLCSFKLKIAGFMNTIIAVCAALALLLAIKGVHKFFVDRALKDKARKEALINRIRDRMESTELANGPFDVPIDQLRDELLGANNIKSMKNIWEEALASVLKYDPQIRLETKRIGGEETDCLVWIHSRSPPGNRTYQNFQDDAAQQRENAESASQMSKDNMSKVWQGQAFENVEGSFNSPPVCPTQCLKIRHMFVPDKPAGSEGVVDAILEKCGQNVNILHIKLDSTANDCCVYMKTASQADAGRAFRALHGWWFDGNLVTVKFLRLERYHERFPEAINACIPLRPSNNLKRSLQGKLWEDRSN